MTVEVGGAGTLGLAFETVLGTYTVPTKWVPIRSESLKLVEGKVWGRNIKGKADITRATKGYFHVEGDIVFEVSGASLLYFLYAARMTIAKVGAMAPWHYTFTGAHVAKSTTAASGPTVRRTLSMLVTRSGNPMGYTGLSVSQLTFTIDSGVLICTASMIGSGEAAQSAGTPTYVAEDPFGPGEITLEVPTATARADADTFTLTINDNGQAANRLNGLRTAAYITWGEREVTASMETDFDSLTDFNDFVAQTSRTFKVKAINTAVTDEVDILLNAAINEDTTVNLTSLGDVVRQSISYHGIYDTTDACTIDVYTAESVV